MLLFMLLNKIFLKYHKTLLILLTFLAGIYGYNLNEFNRTQSVITCNNTLLSSHNLSSNFNESNEVRCNNEENIAEDEELWRIILDRSQLVMTIIGKT